MKTISMDYDEYKEELSSKYSSGYEQALRDFLLAVVEPSSILKHAQICYTFEERNLRNRAFAALGLNPDLGGTNEPA